MASELGRVTDPSALDDERAGLAQIETFAPRSWSGRRARLQLPKSLVCRGCQGGGCDACGRSGAFRLDPDPAARELELDVPTFVKPVVAVRVPRPLGDDAPVKQLLVLIEERAEPDPRLRLIDAAIVVEPAPAPGFGNPWLWAYVAGAVAVVAALARLLAG